MLPAVFNRDEITQERIAYWTEHYLPKDVTPQERDHYVGVCRARGLNPEARHIYLIKVGGRASIVLSIDAYRLIAQRTGAYAGILPVAFEFDPKQPGKPLNATITVQKFVQGQVRDFSATAYFSEFYKPSRDGKKSLWDTMPLTMLEKCAEAKALRKAFPEELSSYYIREEMVDAEVEQPAALTQAAQSAPKPATDIVVTSDPKVKEWIHKKLQQASVPEEEWAEIIDALNGYPKNELLVQLKTIIADRTPLSTEG
jgi:phage recombination protein Bet